MRLWIHLLGVMEKSKPVLNVQLFSSPWANGPCGRYRPCTKDSHAKENAGDTDVRGRPVCGNDQGHHRGRRLSVRGHHRRPDPGPHLEGVRGEDTVRGTDRPREPDGGAHLRGDRDEAPGARVPVPLPDALLPRSCKDRGRDHGPCGGHGGDLRKAAKAQDAVHQPAEGSGARRRGDYRSPSTGAGKTREPLTKKGGEEMRKTVLVLGMVLLFATTGLAADTIKLGGMLPLSGRAADLGSTRKQGGGLGGQEEEA